MAAREPKKHEMPTQKPEVRAHNFSEVALGYSAETAVAEAERCLNCKKRTCSCRSTEMSRLQKQAVYAGLSGKYRHSRIHLTYKAK